MSATVIVGFPLDDTRGEERHEFPAGTNLASILMQLSPDRWGGMTVELYFGSVDPEGFTDVAKAADIEVNDGEVWHVAVLPAEPVSTAAVITAVAGALGGGAFATVVATVLVYTAISAISMAISFGLSMLLRPGRQADKAPAASDQPSSLNSLALPRNSFRPLSRVPDIYGRLRHWPDLIFPAVSRWERVSFPNPTRGGLENTLDTAEQFVYAVYCIGRGSYQLSDFRFGDSDIGTANGSVSVYQPGQEIPADVMMSYPVVNLSRFELGGGGTPNQWSPWYDISSDQVDEIWAQVAWPSGAIVSLAGKKVYPPDLWNSITVEITVEGERLDADGNVVETQSWTTGFISRTRNEMRQTYRWPATRGRWRVRVSESNVFNQAWKGVTFTPYKKTYLESVVGFSSLDAAKRTFNNETVVVVRASNRGGTATQNLEAFNCIAERILPTQVNGATAGVLSAPVVDRRWITAAINTLTDPVICGFDPREIDWQSLVDVQTSLGNYPTGFEEPEFNGIFDRQMSADEQLQLISRKARAMHFMSAGKVTFARDERRDGVSAIFNRRNRMAERGGVGLALRLPGPDEFDGVEITYINELDGYRQTTYTYPEGVTVINPLTIDLVGATKPHEVCRRARYEYAVNRYRRRTQPLRVTEEGQLLLPYDRVGVVAPWDEGVIDGEVLEIDGLDIRLDRPLPAGIDTNARLRLRSQDGRQTSLHTFTPLPLSGPEWLTLDAAPTFDMVAPTDDRQIGTLYNLSRTDAYDEMTQWLVTGADIDDRGVLLTLSEDNDRVFQESDDYLDPCIGCQPTVAPVSAQTELVPVWVPDPIFWPNDILSPTFGTWSTYFDWFIPEGNNGFFVSSTGKLVAVHYYWDFASDPSTTVEGNIRIETGDGSTTEYNGNEGFNLVNGNIFVNQGNGYFILDPNGNLISGPRYPATFGNVPWGDAPGISHDVVYSLVEPPNALWIVKRDIGEPTDPVTTIASLQIANATGAGGFPVYGDSGGQTNGRLIRSGATLAACLRIRIGASFPYTWETRLYLYDLDLNPLGVVEVDDVGLGAGYCTLLGFYKRPSGGYYTVYDNHDTTGDELHSIRIRFFREDGTPEGPSALLYKTLGINTEDLYNYPNKWPEGFALSQDEQYLVTLECHSTTNTDGSVKARQMIVLYELNGGVPTYVSQINADSSPLDPPEQYRLLDGRLVSRGGDLFSAGFQRYTSTTAKPNGGETPIYRRDFEIRRCDECEPSVELVGTRFLGYYADSFPQHIDHTTGGAAVLAYEVPSGETAITSLNDGEAMLPVGGPVEASLSNYNTDSYVLDIPACTLLPDGGRLVINKASYGSSFYGVTSGVWAWTFDPDGTLLYGPTLLIGLDRTLGDLPGYGEISGAVFRGINAGVAEVDLLLGAGSFPTVWRLRRINAATHATIVADVNIADSANRIIQPINSLHLAGGNLIIVYDRRVSPATTTDLAFLLYDSSFSLIAGPVEFRDYAYGGASDNNAYRLSPKHVEVLDDGTFIMASLRMATTLSNGMQFRTRRFSYTTGAPATSSQAVFTVNLLFPGYVDFDAVDRYPWSFSVSRDGRHMLVAEARCTITDPINEYWSAFQYATLFENVGGRWEERNSVNINPDFYQSDTWFGLPYVEISRQADGDFLLAFDNYQYDDVTFLYDFYDVRYRRCTIRTCPS